MMDATAAVLDEAARVPVGADVAVAAPARRIEKRTQTRYLAHWRAALILDDAGGRSVLIGRTRDISLTGCSLVVDCNLAAPRAVKVVLQPPVARAGLNADIVEVEGRIVQSWLSGRHDGYVVGVQFLKFKADAQAHLELALRSARPAAAGD